MAVKKTTYRRVRVTPAAREAARKNKLKLYKSFLCTHLMTPTMELGGNDSDKDIKRRVTTSMKIVNEILKQSKITEVTRFNIFD